MEITEIAVIGQGYVGLPLAIEFGKKFPTVGYDIAAERIKELKSGQDHTMEVQPEHLQGNPNLRFTDRLEDIAGANVYIMTVPTPIDRFKNPDLSFLRDASEAVASILAKGDVVIYESTVYPGCTEEICIPILEKRSGMRLNEGFYVGYSPERIVPGEKVRTLTKIVKVTSGSNDEAAEFVDYLYNQILENGTHRAPSLKVAEASKAIENAQRDLNISFVNELALIFSRIGIDTHDVLAAAASKWNFLYFRPGLVGGHCISVDPYYLAHKAEAVGHYPEVLLSGRRINDNMGKHVASSIIKLMIHKSIPVKGSRALILGITFKENCPDMRNTRVVDIVKELREYEIEVEVFDPWLDNLEKYRQELCLNLVEQPKGRYDAVVLAVGHQQFLEMDRYKLRKDPSVFYDIKAFLPKEEVDGRL